MTRLRRLLTGLLAPAAAAIAQNSGAAVIVLFAPAIHAALETTYGSSEGAVLEQMVRERVSAALRGGGCEALAQVEITLRDARPTHPTDRQIGDNAALDRLRTHYLGGAAFNVRFLDPAGRELESLRYNWYAQDYHQGSRAAEPWGDVRLASEGLGSQLARECRALARPRPSSP